jgi:maleamate amidohydrolase
VEEYIMKLDPKDTYLLLIDLQENSLPDAEWPVFEYPRILERAKSVLEAARSVELGVMHVALAFAPQDYKKTPHLPLPETPRRDAKLNDPIAAPVAPRDGETVILKSCRSAFFGTNLHERLQTLGCKKLVIVGVWTDASIFFTVVDAVRLGYRVALVEDAMGSVTEAMHQVATINLANRLYHGAITSSAALISAMRNPQTELAAWSLKGPLPFQYSLDGIPQAYREIVSAGQAA